MNIGDIKAVGVVGAGLGVVELTVALLHVFESPRDKIVWDVGHQGYPWKVLTGRNDRFPTLRQESGLNGFLRRSESAHDVFGAGHAGTAVSAAFGIATARDIKKEDFHVVAVPPPRNDNMEFHLLHSKKHSILSFICNVGIPPEVGMTKFTVFIL